MITGAPPYFDLEPLAALFRIVRDDCPPLPQGVSPALTDFLRQCFQKEPSMRATAAMLLEHPWLQKSAIPPIAAEREVRLLNSRSVGCGSGWGTPTAPNNTSVGLLTEASMDSVANTVRLFVKQSASTPTTPHHQSTQPNSSSMSSISSGTPQAKFHEAPSLPPSGGVALPPADGIAMINRNALPLSPLGGAADGIAEWDDIFGATTTDNLRDSRISNGSMSRPTGIATLSSQTSSTVGIDIPRIPNTKSTTGTEENDMRESLIRRGLMPLPVVPVPHTLNSASSSTGISSVSSNASNGSGGTSSGIYGSSSMTLGSRSRVLAMSFLPINDNIVEGSVQYRSDGIVPLVAYRENSDNDVWDSDFESLPSTQQNVESQHASSTPFVQRQHRQYTLPNISKCLEYNPLMLINNSDILTTTYIQLIAWTRMITEAPVEELRAEFLLHSNALHRLNFHPQIAQIGVLILQMIYSLQHDIGQVYKQHKMSTHLLEAHHLEIWMILSYIHHCLPLNRSLIYFEIDSTLLLRILSPLDLQLII